MSLKLIYESILFEAKIDVVKSKYPEHTMLLDYFKDVKPKYIEWVAKHFASKNQMHNTAMKKIFEDPENSNLVDTINEVIGDWVRALNEFDKFCEMNFIKNKDIQKYKDFPEVQESVRVAKLDYEARQNEKEEEKRHAPIKIFEDQSFLVVRPTTARASCKYGNGTEWCISATKSENYFNSYTDKGYKFIFLINKKTNDKDAIAYNEDYLDIAPHFYEIYNANDVNISFEELQHKYPTNVLAAAEGHIGNEKNFNIIHEEKNGILWAPAGKTNSLKIRTNISGDDYGDIFTVFKYPSKDGPAIRFKKISIVDIISERNQDPDNFHGMGENYISKAAFEMQISKKLNESVLAKIEEYFGEKIFVLTKEDLVIDLLASNPRSSFDQTVYKIYSSIKSDNENGKFFLNQFNSIAIKMAEELKYSKKNANNFDSKQTESLYNFTYNLKMIFNDIVQNTADKRAAEYFINDDLGQLFRNLRNISRLIPSSADEMERKMKSEFISIDGFIDSILEDISSIRAAYKQTSDQQSFPENKKSKLSLVEIFTKR